MYDDSIIVNELALLASNFKRQVYGVLDFFLSFLTKYENNKAHNMDFLILNPRFKNLHKILLFVGKEQGVLVEKYDKMSFYPMLVKCHEHFASIGKVRQKLFQLGIFFIEIVVWIFLSKLVEKLVKRGLLNFRLYQLDVKTSNVPFQWWEKHKAMFPIVDFLVCQIFGIVGSQIEIERIFSLARILINFRKCHL